MQRLPLIALPLRQLEGTTKGWEEELRAPAGGGGWAFPTPSRWSGVWSGFSGLEQRACPVPGRPATCAHPTPASASHGGHPVSQRQSLARHTPPLRPQGPKMQGVGQGSADPN